MIDFSLLDQGVERKYEITFDKLEEIAVVDKIIASEECPELSERDVLDQLRRDN